MRYGMIGDGVAQPRPARVSHHFSIGGTPATNLAVDTAEGSADRGLALFRDGHVAAAMPLLERAAQNGDARAQYVCATALFNGDHLPCDVSRAFELMQRASDAGLPQAVESLAQMHAIAASAAQVPPSPPVSSDTSLISAEVIARCRQELAGVITVSGGPAAAEGTLHAMVDALLVAELRQRLEALLPQAITAAVTRLR